MVARRAHVVVRQQSPSFLTPSSHAAPDVAAYLNLARHRHRCKMRGGIPLCERCGIRYVEVVLLTSLLPGMRSVRPPILSGYVWILSGYFVLYRFMPRSGNEWKERSPAIHDLYLAVGKPGLFAVLTLIAYLLGSVTVTLVFLDSSLPGDSPVWVPGPFEDETPGRRVLSGASA